METRHGIICLDDESTRVDVADAKLGFMYDILTLKSTYLYISYDIRIVWRYSGYQGMHIWANGWSLLNDIPTNEKRRRNASVHVALLYIKIDMLVMFNIKKAKIRAESSLSESFFARATVTAKPLKLASYI